MTFQHHIMVSKTELQRLEWKEKLAGFITAGISRYQTSVNGTDNLNVTNGIKHTHTHKQPAMEPSVL